jgi:hypothetical protein
VIREDGFRLFGQTVRKPTGHLPRQPALSGTSMPGCELDARLPGCHCDPVQLVRVASSKDPNLGSSILHLLAKVKGYTFSMAKMNGPKRARKEWEKGVETTHKSKWLHAEGLCRKAVAAYPRYAEC